MWVWVGLGGLHFLRQTGPMVWKILQTWRRSNDSFLLFNKKIFHLLIKKMQNLFLRLICPFRPPPPTRQTSSAWSFVILLWLNVFLHFDKKFFLKSEKKLIRWGEEEIWKKRITGHVRASSSVFRQAEYKSREFTPKNYKAPPIRFSFSTYKLINSSLLWGHAFSWAFLKQHLRSVDCVLSKDWASVILMIFQIIKKNVVKSRYLLR